MSIFDTKNDRETLEVGDKTRDSRITNYLAFEAHSGEKGHPILYSGDAESSPCNFPGLISRWHVPYLDRTWNALFLHYLCFMTKD